MFQIDYKSNVPICNQIVHSVIRMKALGVLKGGEPLPSVRGLASKLAVNPNTIQKAYAILESRNVIYSVKGKGSFLADDEAAHRAVLENARENFADAVKSARELGLDEEELGTLIREIYSKGGEDRT